VRFAGVQNSVTPTAFVQRQGDVTEIIWPKSIATAPLK
jgi:branched-chain amino acid transport system substrate-binding protein